MEAIDKTNKGSDAAANLAGDARVPMPLREKTFDELEPAEQIQRLRMELILLRELTQSQQMLIDRLMVHDHKADGTMVVPMRASADRLGNAGRRDPLR